MLKASLLDDETFITVQFKSTASKRTTCSLEKKHL